MGDRLGHLQFHDAITLLHHSFATPKMMHILHSAPCLSSSQLPSYDLLLKSTLSNITNIDFHNNVYSWLQATLPVNHGGIGVRSVVHLAPSAFLASADGSSALTPRILPLRFNEILYPEIGVALSLWGNDQSQSPPQPPFSHLQKSWDIPCILSRVESLL